MTDVTNGVSFVTQTALNNTLSAFSTILNPVEGIRNVVTPFVSSLNTLLNYGIISTINGTLALHAHVVEGAHEIVNAIIDTGNFIITTGQPVLRNIFTRIINRLDKSIANVYGIIIGRANFALSIMGRVQNRIENIVDRIFGRLDSCTVKMTSLLMVSASNGIKAYTENATNIIRQIDGKMDAQYQSFATHLNTTAAEFMVYASNVTANLLDDIVTIYNATENKSADFMTCLNQTSDLTVFIEVMINDNVAVCLEQAFAQANVTDANLARELAVLESTAANATAAVCKCVENVSVANMLQRATATTCATNELKKLTTDSIKADAETISEFQKTTLAEVKTEFDTCMSNIDEQVPGLEDFIMAEVVSCAQLM